MEALAYMHAHAACEEVAEGIKYDFPRWELNWKPPSSAWIGLLATVAAISILSTTSGAFAISAGRYYVANSRGLHVRSSPSFGYNVIYTRGDGQPVDLTGRTSGLWAETVPGNWVYASLLTDGGSSNPSGSRGGRYILARGTQNQAVADVQSRLRDIGYYIGSGVDGIYGYHTERAVLQFQSRNGLIADGKVGSQTRSALFGTGRIMNPL